MIHAYSIAAVVSFLCDSAVPIAYVIPILYI